LSRKIVIPEDELRRLYETDGLSQGQIGRLYGCGHSPVGDRMREFGIKARTNAQAVVRSKSHAVQRRPFTGDEFERGYLCGFCKGDTHVSLTGPGSETIVVRSGSTRQEQVDLFRHIFEPYSHIWESKPDKRGAVNQAAFLDDVSFEWLLDREDRIPEHVVASPQAMLGYLTGYTDAEGHIGVYSRVVFTLESCDENILRQLYEFIHAQEIECPPPRITKMRGSPRSDRGTFARDYWCLAVNRTDSQIRLLEWLKPHLRHAKRQRDLMLALAFFSNRRN
jgi:hypothetical protein